MNGLYEALGQWLGTRGTLWLRAACEIVIIFAFVYVFLRFLQGTRGAGVLRGLTVMLGLAAVLVVFITRKFDLVRVEWVFRNLVPVVLIPVIVLFQPELRRALVRLGQNPLFDMFFRTHSQLTEELVKAVTSMARDKIGALIAIERQVGLSSYVERGVRLDAEVTAETIKTIFWPGTPLHDGAIVIRQQRIVAAGCLFPLTDNPTFSTELGTRHRAGIGITEESDAISIIVSEQTGRISLAVRGAIQQDLDEKALRRALEDIAAAPLEEQ
jgi:diadenylate cyclase